MLISIKEDPLKPSRDSFRQCLHQHPHGVFAHDQTDIRGGKTGIHQGLCHLLHLSGMKRRGDSTTKIGSQRHVFDADNICRVADGFCDARRADIADGFRPESDTDHAAGRGNPAQLSVGKIAD